MLGKKSDFIARASSLAILIGLTAPSPRSDSAPSPKGDLSRLSAVGPAAEPDQFASQWVLVNGRLKEHQTAEALLERARLYLLRHDPDAAVADATAALKLAPGSSKVLEFRAQAYMNEQHYESARCDINSLIALDGKKADYYVLLSHCYDLENNVPAAENALAQALQVKPGDPALYVMKAALYGKRKEYDQTMQTINSGLAVAPGSEPLLFARAFANEDIRGDHAGALKDLNDIIAQHPEHLKAYDEKAKIELRMGDAAVSIRDYDILIAKIEKREHSLMLSAVEEMNKNKKSPSRSPDVLHPAAAQAQALARERARVLDARALAKWSLADIQGAYDDLLEAHVRWPRNEKISYDLGHVSFAAGRLDQSREVLQEIIRSSPESSEASFSQAYIDIAAGDYKAAAGDFVKVIRSSQDPDSVKYATVYLALVAKLVPASVNEEVLDAELKKEDLSKWPLLFVQVLQGGSDDAKLDALPLKAGELAELHAFRGLADLSRKGDAKAKEQFQWVVDHGPCDYLEYAMSKAIVKRL